MISGLDRKVIRDLGRMKGQAFAVAVVMGCGLAMMIMARSLIHSLETTRIEYYEAHRFADVFVQLKRAPLSVAAAVAALPGVATVQAGISAQITVDVPGLDEPAGGQVRSLPPLGVPALNRLFLRRGRWLEPGSRDEVLVGESFADANHLGPGDTVALLLNQRRREFRIAGIVLSPEFIFESRPGSALPDNRTYGIFWLSWDELAGAFDLDGAFNHLVVKLVSPRMEPAVILALDHLLEPYGGQNAYGRADHPSHVRVSDEIRVLQTLAIGFPVVFLSVAAFMINAVISRLITLQREQIAILKAFGYSNRQIALHYLKFAFVMVGLGTVLGGAGGIIMGRQIVQLYHLFFRFPELHFRFDRPSLVLALAVCATAAAVGVLGAVRRAAALPPAEAMRPEPPSSFRRALVERLGVASWFSHSFRIAVRNLERRPMQALFTCAGLALATGILVIPNAFRDGVAEIMDFQWDVVQRHDLSLGFVEPSSAKARHAVENLPGVVQVEPFRYAVARLRFGQHRRRVVVQGLPAEALHSRVVGDGYRRLRLSGDGLVVSAKLAEVLHARVGDLLTVEFLEGRRQVRSVPLIGLAQDFAGVAAYVDLAGLNRLLGEGEVISGATVRVDGAARAEFLKRLKEVPRVSWVAIKDSLRANFRRTTAASINLIQTIYLVFATVVAFGVVYNNARISLAERARELATLRVIGFTQSEVGAILVTELVLLGLLAVPVGLVMGTGFATLIIGTVNTETVRVPLILTSGNYAFAAATVAVASTVSAFLVLRRLARLNLVGVLKAPE